MRINRCSFPFKTYKIKVLPLYSGCFNHPKHRSYSICPFTLQPGCKTTSIDQPFFINGPKSRYSTGSSPFSDRRVDFTHLPVSKPFAGNLKSLGIEELRLFQYIVFKLLSDHLAGVPNPVAKTSFLRLILYNEQGSGLSIGTLAPLLYLYSLPRTTSRRSASPCSRPSGSLLILCSKNSVHDVSNLILALNPSAKCLVLDETRGSDHVGKDFDATSKESINRALKETLITQEGSYEIILASHNALPGISRRRNRRVFPPLAAVSCVLFDDFSESIENCHGSDPFSETLKLVRSSKAATTAGSEAENMHVICLASSLSDAFAEYARKNMPNYSLYDFKHGTKQRLISDARTDVLKVEAEFGESRVVNLEAEGGTNPGVEHSICKVSKSEKYERATVLKNLVYAYLDLPTFMASQALPRCLKRPATSAKCIVFASNRKQLTNLANMQEFAEISVHLGRHLSVYERAKAIAAFNNLTRPVMIATDNSVHGASFEGVSHIFNFNPPKTAESYRARAAMARKTNALCVTLYSNDQYAALVPILKETAKRVSVHIVPSGEYMKRHDLRWLRKFVAEMANDHKNLIAPYAARAEQLLAKFGDSVVAKCANALLSDGLELCGTDAGEDALVPNSILTGKAGFTAVALTDGTMQHLRDEDDVRRLFAQYVEGAGSAGLGRCCRTENGFVVDVPNRHLRNFVELSRDNPDICVQVATSVPKILLNDPGPHIAKVHRKGLPWTAVGIRRLPRTWA